MLIFQVEQSGRENLTIPRNIKAKSVSISDNYMVTEYHSGEWGLVFYTESATKTLSCQSSRT